MVNDKDIFNILLIEDNEGDILLTRKAISMSNHQAQIHVTKNGREGLEFLQKQGHYESCPTPDLILLDLNMPEMNGKEVLRAVKKIDHLKVIPIVVLSTSISDKDISESYHLNASSYIKKPVDFFRFGDAIKNMLNYWFNVVLLPQ